MASDIEHFECDKLWTSREKDVIDILDGKARIKDSLFYYVIGTYTFVKFNGQKKVALIKTKKIMCNEEEALTIIRDTHVENGHLNEDKTFHKIRENYANISLLMIRHVIEECETCVKKSENIVLGEVVVGSFSTTDLNLRGLVDLIDIYNVPEEGFKYILFYEEQVTKHCYLRPLNSKSEKEIAKNLLGIFLNFGAPNVLQSNSGIEFTKKIIEELRQIFPHLVLISGHPKHPQSQESINQRNQLVKNSLKSWKHDNKNSTWRTGLKYVQWGLNTTYKEEIKMEPFKAKYGQQPASSLWSTLPVEFTNKIKTGIMEEELEKIINTEYPVTIEDIRIEPIPIIETVGMNEN